MSKLACRCGHIISDSIHPCPTEGTVSSQQDHDRWRPDLTAAVGDFVDAIQVGGRTEWIRSFFLEGYPLEVSNAEVISDILSRFEWEATKSVAECEKCGRLWVQVSADKNVYRSYSPDDPGYAGILRGSPQNEE